MFGVDGISAAGTTAADAPPASDKVNPAAPNTGTAFVIRFRFEACFARGMVASSISCKKIESSHESYSLRGLHARLGAAPGHGELLDFIFMNIQFIFMNKIGIAWSQCP
jgi:hypothetical protein